MLSPTSLLRRVRKPAKNIGRALNFFSFGHGDAGTYEPVPGVGPTQVRNCTSGWRTRVIVLVSLQVALGLTRDSTIPTLETDGTENIVSALQFSSARFAALDAVKLVCCAGLVYIETRRNSQDGLSSSSSSGSAEVEAQPLSADEAWQNETSRSVASGNSKPLILGSSRSNIAISLLTLLLIANSYLVVYFVNSGIVSAILIHLSSVFVPLLSAVFLLLFDAWTGSSQQWIGVLLQILGLLSFESQSSLPDISGPSIIFLVTLALLASLTCIAIYDVYKRHESSISSKFNTRLFAFGLVAHLSILILSNLFVSNSTILSTTRNSLRGFLALALRASVDIASLNLIYNHGPVLFAVLTSLSTTFLLAFSGFSNGSSSVSEFCSLAVALLGFYAYWAGEAQHGDSVDTCDSSEKKTLPSRILLPAALFLLLGTVVYSSSNVFAAHAETETQSGKPVLWDQFRTQSGETMVFADLPYMPPSPLPPPEPTCFRVPLPSEQFFVGNRTYHEFDDVLLIVFFSHARYDVNLDYYKEVYSEFFPNMVFVGPKSREDKGFEHSYDVLVDSYESEEDISDWSNYKMAGRMAHHMLYTVLTTSPYSDNCYKGFLWAPFDTLLNVPRLQAFDQDRIWYFSPWGEYVPNRAVDQEEWMNASNHAPPARISPDPEIDFEKEYRGWWVDWWWGDPHYGIPVCKYAFEHVPLELRERMAQRFTKNETRYIGGSADTLYVPARLADDFVHLLGTFLNTSCFLEIAVPTVVHLLVPEDEMIQFVDHWWIWNPPFNASFVRDRWERGMEVDTFHTFHWGDKDEDGMWRANPRNIEDLRELFRESAARQGVPWLSS